MYLNEKITQDDAQWNKASYEVLDWDLSKLRIIELVADKNGCIRVKENGEVNGDKKLVLASK
jgi:hypothetical protein